MRRQSLRSSLGRSSEAAPLFGDASASHLSRPRAVTRVTRERVRAKSTRFTLLVYDDADAAYLSPTL